MKFLVLVSSVLFFLPGNHCVLHSMLAVVLICKSVADTKADLYQVFDTRCSQEVTFICSSDTYGGIIEWRVLLMDGGEVVASFNSHRFNGTELAKKGRGATDVIGRLHFGNSSSFNSSLTVPANLTFTNVTCNDYSQDYQPQPFNCK